MGLVAAVAIPAVVGAGASLIGSSNNNKAINASTAAQERSAAEQVALQREIYGKNEGYLSPFMSRGNAAGDTINALLGIGGTTTANGTGGVSPQQAATDAYNLFKQSTGYQDRLQEGYNAVNSNYAGNGLLQSGAAQKALLRYGQSQASNEFGNYLGALGNQQGVGLSGASALAGVGQSYANNMGQISQNSANYAGQAAVARANNNNSLFGSLSGIAGNTFGSLSSYGAFGGGGFNQAAALASANGALSNIPVMPFG